MGGSVEFKLPGPEYERVAWVHNEHFVGSITPLELTLRELRPQTLNDDGLPNSIYVNGYSFGREPRIRESSVEPDETIVLGWREHRMPLVESVCAELEAFQVGSVEQGLWRDTLALQEERFWEAFGGVHRDTMGQVFPASARWVALYTKRFGEAAQGDALAMLGGFPNASSARAAALWELSRLAAHDTFVLAAADAGELPADSLSDSARLFREHWDALMKRFGFTTTTHLIDLPTWREDPAIPLGMIASMAREPWERSPRLAEIYATRRRLELEEALERLDAEADPELALMRRVQRVARHLAPASEDHNLLCDQQLIAAARVKWLRIGTHLAASGLLASEHDVFYLTLGELLAALEQGEATPDAALSERRRLQDQWRSVTPPARLGAESQPAEGRGAAGRTDRIEVRGIAASAGVYRGRARIVTGLPEAHRLQPGDVLVCAATSPEWTPYFGVVGALVTGTGSLLAHAAVVAREFGIPAVVGATGATTVIADGAVIVVDGSRGVVTVEQTYPEGSPK